MTRKVEVEIAYSPHASPLPHSQVVCMSFISLSWSILMLASCSWVISDAVSYTHLTLPTIYSV